MNPDTLLAELRHAASHLAADAALHRAADAQWMAAFAAEKSARGAAA